MPSVQTLLQKWNEMLDRRRQEASKPVVHRWAFLQDEQGRDISSELGLSPGSAIYSSIASEVIPRPPKLVTRTYIRGDLSWGEYDYASYPQRYLSCAPHMAFIRTDLSPHEWLDEKRIITSLLPDKKGPDAVKLSPQTTKYLKLFVDVVSGHLLPTYKDEPNPPGSLVPLHAVAQLTTALDMLTRASVHKGSVPIILSCMKRWTLEVYAFRDWVKLFPWSDQKVAGFRIGAFTTDIGVYRALSGLHVPVCLLGLLDLRASACLQVPKARRPVKCSVDSRHYEDVNGYTLPKEDGYDGEQFITLDFSFYPPCVQDPLDFTAAARDDRLREKKSLPPFHPVIASLCSDLQSPKVKEPKVFYDANSRRNKNKRPSPPWYPTPISSWASAVQETDQQTMFNSAIRFSKQNPAAIERIPPRRSVPAARELKPPRFLVPPDHLFVNSAPGVGFDKRVEMAMRVWITVRRRWLARLVEGWGNWNLEGMSGLLTTQWSQLFKLTNWKCKWPPGTVWEESCFYLYGGELLLGSTPLSSEELAVIDAECQDLKSDATRRLIAWDVNLTLWRLDFILHDERMCVDSRLQVNSAENGRRAELEYFLQLDIPGNNAEFATTMPWLQSFVKLVRDWPRCPQQVQDAVIDEHMSKDDFDLIQKRALIFWTQSFWDTYKEYPVIPLERPDGEQVVFSPTSSLLRFRPFALCT